MRVLHPTKPSENRLGNGKSQLNGKILYRYRWKNCPLSFKTTASHVINHMSSTVSNLPTDLEFGSHIKHPWIRNHWSLGAYTSSWHCPLTPWQNLPPSHLTCFSAPQYPGIACVQRKQTYCLTVSAHCAWLGHAVLKCAEELSSAIFGMIPCRTRDGKMGLTSRLS